MKTRVEKLIGVGVQIGMLLATVALTVAACSDAKVNKLTIASQRPYLSISGITLTIQGEEINGIMGLRNIGNRPAGWPEFVYYILAVDKNGNELSACEQTKTFNEIVPSSEPMIAKLPPVTVKNGEGRFVLLQFNYSDPMYDPSLKYTQNPFFFNLPPDKNGLLSDVTDLGDIHKLQNFMEQNPCQ